MTRIALIVSLGGFLMGFDASVISGVVGFIEVEFALSRLELGWSASSLVLTATIGMLLSGPLSDRIGRRPVLRIAAVLFAVSAVASAAAPDFVALVAARMLGGLGVGAALIVAPMYIAELAAPAIRGRMVSFNQLNIVIGISAAFFSNYLILQSGDSGAAWVDALRLDSAPWRWMLGVEAVPAALYFVALWFVPESPRWLVMQGRDKEAAAVLGRTESIERATREIDDIRRSIASEDTTEPLRALFRPSLRLVLTIGLSIAVLQQITGINSIFFYAPMIFEQSGIGTNAAFMQAVLIGLVNVVFTVVALIWIDRVGRRVLLGFGLAGIAVCMLALAWGFASASYVLDHDAAGDLPAAIDRTALVPLQDRVFDSETSFREALREAVGEALYRQHATAAVRGAIDVNAGLILVAILGFVASFAVSLGPVMWVLFSELFPNRVRGIAVSFVGFVNSLVSFLVTLVFPWQLEVMGNATTFLIYALFAIVGLVLVLRLYPETKGRSLEELEDVLAAR